MVPTNVANELSRLACWEPVHGGVPLHWYRTHPAFDSSILQLGKTVACAHHQSVASLSLGTGNDSETLKAMSIHTCSLESKIHELHCLK
ncbi:hypothetical protein TWF173_002834 [Orbilia oligospora]|nr:hypothetical protein TWF173_002834 [Orbilia oligospora]